MSDKYPSYFLFTVAIYLITFLYGIRFVLDGITENLLGFLDFYLISAIIIVPAILAILYNLNEKNMMLWKHASWIRSAAFVAMVISTLFVVVFLIPISL